MPYDFIIKAYLYTLIYYQMHALHSFEFVCRNKVGLVKRWLLYLLKSTAHGFYRRFGLNALHLSDDRKEAALKTQFYILLVLF
jgi:hypothetical protein